MIMLQKASPGMKFAVLFAAAMFSVVIRTAQAGGGKLDRLTFPNASRSSCGSWQVDGGYGSGQTDLQLEDGNGTLLFQHSYPKLNVNGIVATGIFKTQPKKNPITFSVGPLSIAADNPCLPSSGAGRMVFNSNGKLYMISSVQAISTSRPGVNVQASDPQPFLPAKFDALGAQDQAWSPDGNHLVFRGKFNDVTQIYSADLNGNTIQELTTNNAPKGPVSWSPDGKKLAFSEDLLPAPKSGAGSVLAIVNADGTNPRILTTTVSAYFPSWSPDSKTLAFWSTSDSGDTRAIYTIAADGTHQQQVANSPALDAYPPPWSSDGHQIVFSDWVGARMGIYTVNADGSALRPLTNDSQADNFRPVWSPDGKHIAFLHGQEGGGGGTCEVTVYVMEADGTNPTSITDRQVACG